MNYSTSNSIVPVEKLRLYKSNGYNLLHIDKDTFEYHGHFIYVEDDQKSIEGFWFHASLEGEYINYNSYYD